MASDNEEMLSTGTNVSCSILVNDDARKIKQRGMKKGDNNKRELRKKLQDDNEKSIYLYFNIFV